MPGLIDMHSHLAIHEGMLDGRDSFDQMAIGAISQERMRSYLDHKVLQRLVMLVVTCWAWCTSN